MLLGIDIGTSSSKGVLVRPDGHIAWAREDGATTGLEAALRRWFGEPA